MKKLVVFVFSIILSAASLYSVDIYEDIIQTGQELVGAPYRTGGMTPSGFDCSGLINYLCKKYVPALPRISRDMADFGNPVKRNSLVPGDLLFFATGSSPGTITHVALYIGQNSILHSISNGPDRGVTITSLSARYWKNRYYSASRIFSETSGGKENELPGTKKNVTDFQFAKGKYTGETQGGEPEGQGILVMNNGDRYEGMFASGTFNGKGTYFWKDGRSWSGEFREGSMVDASVNEEENYIQKEDSPWENWDGIVEGDFQLWLQQEKDAFEEWKKNN